MKEQFGFSIYKFAQSGKTILGYKDGNYELGRSFGGLGAVSVAVADMNKDGINELYYISSWGSGVIRPEVGCFDPVKGEVVTFEYRYLDMMAYFETDNYMFAVDDGNLGVYTAISQNGRSYPDMVAGVLAAKVVYDSGEIKLIEPWDKKE